MNDPAIQPILISAQQARPDPGNEPALPPLSCDIRAGRIVFLMGLHHSLSLPYMQLLAGLKAPVSGRLEILGNDYRHMSAQQRLQLRQKAGFVMQGGPLLSVLDGIENLMLAARYHQLGQEKTLQEKARLLLSEFPHVADYQVLPGFMNKLQRRLLAIARPLMLDPVVLLLDNPFDGLDHDDRIIVARYISNIANHGEITLVVSCDDLYFLHSLADQIIFCDYDEALVFDSWKSFHQSNQKSISLLFKQEHI